MFMSGSRMLKSFIVENNNYAIEYLEKEGFREFSPGIKTKKKMSRNPEGFPSMPKTLRLRDFKK